MVTSFCMILLPLAQFHKAKYIVIGDQKDLDFHFEDKFGYRCYPSYDQTTEWRKQQKKIIKTITNNAADVVSLISPLTDIAITRILFKRYPELGKYQISCPSLDCSKEKRWCHNCSVCVASSIFMLANRISQKKAKLRKKFLSKKYKSLFVLFGMNEKDAYYENSKSRDQQLLAFYMMYRNGTKGYLIDLFKKKFLKEAKQREDELYNFFFKIHKNTLPRNLKKKIYPILKEELTLC